MAKSEKRKIGDIGEDVACKYLQNKGFRVVERNYWRPWGEIDIVATRQLAGEEILIFVEVKSVSREKLGAGEGSGSREPGSREIRPEENMHPAKLKRLHRAVQTYLLEKKVPEEKVWRIDLACVYLDFSAKRARVEYLENIT